jgi:predicted DCC family thiol-disulfide oxidoreductase YuxK
MHNRIILFYDGDCALCNKSVQFVIDHEKKISPPIMFCDLQSDYAKNLLASYHYNFNSLNTLVLLIDKNVYYRSDAALYLTKHLKTPYNLLIGLKLIPKFIRDAVYNFIAKNRKKIIKTAFCYIPTPDLKNRFLS